MLKILDTLGIFSLSALPASGTAGEVAYYNGAFYGWTGSAWKSLNNDATTKADVGLGNVDNTSDINKPISTATQTALDAKVSKGQIGLSGLTSTNSSRIVGRRSDSAGGLEELTLGSSLLLSSTVINLAPSAAGTLFGNKTASSATPVALTGAEATALLGVFTDSLKGLVPAPGPSSGKFLKDDGTWAAISPPASTAASTSFSPAGNIAATDVQNAIQELDAEKSPIGHNHDATYQPLDTQLTSLAALTYSGNANRLIRINGSETGFALYTLDVFLGASSSAAGSTGLVPAPASGDQTKFLRGDGTWQTVLTSSSASGTSFTPYGNIAATDVQSAVQELDDEKAKTGSIGSSGLSMSTARILGRSSANTGAVEELTGVSATALLNNFTTSTKGLVPAPGTSSGKFLKDDGSWASPLPVDFDPVSATGTGASQDITLPVSGLVSHQVLVFVNGIRYKSTEYSISGTTLTLTTNASGDDIEILRR